MSTHPVPDRTSQGLVTRLVTSVFFRQATVVSNVAIAPALHRIALEGDSLRGVAWLPGDKLQIRLGHGLQTRTYTPIEWDPLAGRTAFLAQTLAPGPGSAWVAEAMPGQQVEVMGPRRSLVLDKLDPAHGVVLGDETALGLALAWGASRVVLEVNDPGSLDPVCRAQGLRCILLAKQADGQHLAEMERLMWDCATVDTHFVLAGRASTVQRLHQRLRAGSVQARRIHTKAYWADGKAGLD